MDKNTADSEYADRLERLTNKKWKVILDVQRPYRWNLKRLNPGLTLDIGCGVGRHLVNLPRGSVGIDLNKHSVSKVKSLGCDAYIPEEFVAAYIGNFANDTPHVRDLRHQKRKVAPC